MEKELKPLQGYGFNLMKAGYNVYMTGHAGTGKTYVLKKYIEYRRNMGYNVMVVAPTGVAAINIGGSTINSQFMHGILIDTKMPIDEEKLNNLVNSDVLIIEEISMTSIYDFDYIIKYYNSANDRRKRLGRKPIQLIVCGDFFQLLPVITERDSKILSQMYPDLKRGCCFESKYWDMLDFKYVILTETVRQENSEFAEALNSIRLGHLDSIKYILEHCSKTPIEDGLNLYGLRSSVNKKNAEELNRLDTPMSTFKAMVTGHAKIDDTPAEEEVNIKVGARVMCLVNLREPNGELIVGNGSIGTVNYIDTANGVVTVEFDEGIVKDIKPYTWDVMEYRIKDGQELSKFPELVPCVIGSVVQLPLKLAYAITIHKSQGQTYQSININPYSWDCGQLYVALSRVKSLDRLYLTNDILTYYIQVSLEVIAFYNSIVDKANKYVDVSKDLIKHEETVYKQEEANTLLGLLGRL